MPPRKRYRSSGALVSQIVETDATLTSGGVLIVKFTDFEHRSGKLVMKKIQADLGYASGSTGALQECTFAVIAKPISEGVPVTSDFINEKYVKWHRQCYATRDDTNNWNQVDLLHVQEILKVVVELGWDLYFAVLNGVGTTNFVVSMVRLFVKYI